MRTTERDMTRAWLPTGASALRLMHYWWPLAVGWSYVVVVQRGMGQAPDEFGLATLFFGILAAYSLDRVLDPSGHDGRRVTMLLAVVGSLATAACGAAAWHLPLQTLAVVPLLGVVSMSYPTLKRAPLVKSLVLPTVWIWAVLALPFGDGSLFGWRVLLQPVVLPLLLLNAVGCLLCDVKDEARDRAAGVQSVPALFGRTLSLRLAILLSVVAAVVALAEHRPGILISAAALSATTFAPSLVAEETIGPLLVDAILTLPGVLISARLI